MVWRQLLLHHYSRSLPQGTQFFAFPVCVGSVQDIYQVTFLESPGIGTQIILALEPRLRRAQSGSCHLVSLGGLFPEVCQVLSWTSTPGVGSGTGYRRFPTPGVGSGTGYRRSPTPGVGSGTGYRRSPFPASAGWVYTQCCYCMDMERSAPAICGRYSTHFHLFWVFLT